MAHHLEWLLKLHLQVLVLTVFLNNAECCARSRSFKMQEDEEIIPDIEDNSVEASPDVDRKPVDCVGLSPFVSKIFKNFFTPQSNEKVNTRFFLYTRENRTPTEVNTDSPPSKFPAGRAMTFIVHGFLSSAEEEWVQNMADAFLHKRDTNVIAVDWNGSWRYWRAVANTRVAGAELAGFLEMLNDKNIVSPENIHLVGHSLGAHICSFAATMFSGNSGRNISRITGLDPAQPCYSSMKDYMRLGPSDANFVDVVHTNGKLLSRLGLGIPQPVGHVDFYPNGGMCQPGCIEGRDESYKLPGILKIFSAVADVVLQVKTAICSHGRSYMLFTDSIRFYNCSFWGWKWNGDHKSMEPYPSSTCTVENCTEMGFLTDAFPARGSFYVPTREEQPFCIPDHKTDLDMAESLFNMYKNITRSSESVA